jgi:ABC-2 type transport system permease protein
MSGARAGARTERMRATRLVASRELHETFRRKSFWIVLAVLVVGSSLAMILPEVLDSGTTRYDVAVVPASTSAEGFESSLQSVSRELDAEIRFRRVATAPAARKLVDDNHVDVAVVLSDDPTVIVRKGENDTLVGATRQALALSALSSKLSASGLDSGAIADILAAPPPKLQEIDADDSDRVAGAAIVSLVLYLVLLMLMIQAANGTAIEKSNRISEVLLPIVRPAPLLFGKVIGVGLVGIASLAAAAIPLVIKTAAGGDLPAGLGPAVVGGAPWFVLGLVLYLTIAGALGALVERQEETGTVITPLSLVLVATYILAQSAAGTSLGAMLAIFPLTSPVVMPARIALGDASAAEIVASLALGVVSVVVVLRFGAAMYRRGIVHTGRRMRVREALQGG